MNDKILNNSAYIVSELNELHKDSIKQRFKLLVAAFINLFTGDGVTYKVGNKLVVASGYEDEGVSFDYFLKQKGSDRFTHHAVTYDNINPPIGYHNGKRLGK